MNFNEFFRFISSLVNIYSINKALQKSIYFIGYLKRPCNGGRKAIFSHVIFKNSLI